MACYAVESLQSVPFYALSPGHEDKRPPFCYIIVFMKDEIFPINRDIDDHIDQFEEIGIE